MPNKNKCTDPLPAGEAPLRNPVTPETHRGARHYRLQRVREQLLASGPRTNPWMQESSDRVMQAGEIVSFDTDLIGPYGYCADISRAWTVGHVAPTDEFPAVAHAGKDWDSGGYDGLFEENMVVCVESYIGAKGGPEGIKLEQQVLITADGCEPLSRYPWQDDWLR